MKKSIFIFLTLVLGISLNAKAEDFSAVYNGKTIYYNITSSSSPYTAAVKSSGSSANSYSGVISIPDSVLYSGNYYKITSINNGAFNVCNSLTSVFIPSSVISIGNYAFRICTSLTSITIPSSVSSIGLAAFSGCSGLTSITIPSSVSIIGNLAFQNCTSLDTVFFNAINCNINDSQTGPIFIGCINLNSIIIGDNVIRIPGNVFNDCTGLTSIIIPDSVISIGVSAFQNCSSLTSITIPSFVTSISNNTFYGCTELTSITIPNSIISIGESAFKNCTSLDTVFFNAVNCNVMGTNSNFVFDGCNNLSTIIFGDNVNNIPKNAFKDRIGITSVKISSSVISIGAFAFDGCIGLTLLNIPNSITSIGGGAFHNCTSLDTVFFNPINCHTMSNVPYEVFRGCSNFKTLIIGDSVQVIPNYAFRGRSGLTSVNIPSSVTTIGASAFYECSGIKKITIPSYVTKIGNLAFTLCSSLDTVFFNAINCDTTGSFDNPILGNCINFKTLIIGDSVQSIPSYAFYYCNKLTSITCKSISPPSVQSTSFSYVSKSIPFYVPCLSKSYYQSAANLSAFTNFIGVTTPTFISATICQGDTYNNYGFYFIANTSGLYTQNIQLINGCDSVINLNLIVNPSYNDTIFAKIFNGQTYNQFGFNETNKGFYTQNLQTAIGCDSIVNLSLSFEPIYVDTISASICQGQTYTLYGFNEDSIGFYTQSLITSEGFDSIINLNLMVNPIYNDTVYAEICNGDTYNQFGFNESAAGLYTKSLQTTKGCDSMI
ncbi:MAG: leucine-rich repeat domain-containing protein, partial [Bacteroidales bacterium]|nr:leucine-rich repeat domain-containing protein [Bacteroidales bacterium]